VSFDPTGRTLASGSADQTVKLWESSSGKLLRTLEGHQHRVSSVSFDPTGRTLASGSADQTVKLWESSSGKLLATLAGHLGPVESVSFAAKGRYLVAAGPAGRLQFWDLDSLQTFLYLYTFGPGAWLALLPDGRFDATPEALRYLGYTERGTFNSFTAEELVQEFHDPKAVQEVLAKYTA
jgi:WD40 repeat protein